MSNNLTPLGAPPVMLFEDFITRLRIYYNTRNAENAAKGAALGLNVVWRMAGLAYINVEGGTALDDLGIDDVAPYGAGSPYHFGAVLDGKITGGFHESTNDAYALQRYFLWLADGTGNVGDWPQGKVGRSDSRITGLKGNYTFHGNGGGIDFFNLPNADDDTTGSVFDHQGAIRATVALNSVTDTVDGDNNETVTYVSNTAHGLAVGDDALFYSDDTVEMGYLVGSETRGQISRVEAVTDTTTLVTFDPLYEDLATNPKVRTFDWLENIHWVGKFTFQGPGRRAGSDADSTIIGYSGPKFLYARGCLIDEVVVNGLDYQAVVRDTCVDFTIGMVRGRATPTTSGAIQYCDTLVNAATRCVTKGAVIRGFRHAFDHTINTGSPGVARDCHIYDFDIQGTWRSAVAMHGGARDCTINNTRMKNCRDGVEIRSPGWSALNSYGENCRTIIYLTNQPFGVTVKGVRGKNVNVPVLVQDANILIGQTEMGDLSISDVNVKGVAGSGIIVDATNIPVFSDADSAVISGTTTSMTVGPLELTQMVMTASVSISQFATITQATSGASAYVLKRSGSTLILQRVSGTFDLSGELTVSGTGLGANSVPTSITTISDYDVSGKLDGAEIAVDPDGSGSAVKITRIATHTYDAATERNTFTWSAAVGTAPTTSATYKIRTLIDGLTIDAVDLLECDGVGVYLFGNFRNPRLTNISDRHSVITAQPIIRLASTADNFTRNTNITDIQHYKKDAISVGEHCTGTRINGDFLTRADAVSWIVNESEFADGERFKAGNLAFVGSEGATAIPDMDGVLPYGDWMIEHFGDVSGDCAALFESALTAAAGRKLHGSEGQAYSFETRVEYTGSVDLDMSKSGWFGAANTGIFRFIPNTTDSQLLTSNYVSGATEIACADLGRAPVAGDTVVIWSKALDPANRQLDSAAKYRCAELALVAEGSTATNIKLAAPLRFVEGVADADTPSYANPYTTAFGARVGVVHAEDHCRIKLPKGAYLDGQEAAWSASAFKLFGYVDLETQGGSVTRGYGPALSLVGTMNAVIDNFDVQNLESNAGNGQYGYGINDNGTNTCVNGMSDCNTRHAFTTGAGATLETVTDVASMLGSVRSVDFVVSKGRSVGSVQGPWDAHSCATDGKFVDCVTINSLASGAGSRGQNITYVRPVIRGAVRGITAGTEPNDSFDFVNGDRQKDFTSIKVIDPYIECEGKVFDAENATLEVSGMGRYETTVGQLFANARRGLIRLSGDHRAKLVGDAGETDLGFIKGELAKSWATGDAAGVEQEGTLVLNGSGVTSTTPIAIEMYANNTFTHSGFVRLTLPNPTVLLTTTGTVTSLGEGQILFDINGVADNLGITNLASHLAARVKSVDGLVVQGFIHSGSNANGTWTKSPDGTMIQTHTLTGIDINTAANSQFQSASVTWTFPTAFFNGTWVGRGDITGTSQGIAVHLAGVSTTFANVRAWSGTLQLSRELTVEVRGRWKA